MRTARLLGEHGVTGGGRVAAGCVATRPLRVRVTIDGGTMVPTFARGLASAAARADMESGLACECGRGGCRYRG
jgi:hypothetical protein